MKLSKRHLNAIRTFVTGGTYDAAAAAANVSRATVAVWLTDDDFSAELSRQRNAAIEASTTRLLGSFDLAVGTLRDGCKGAATAGQIRSANFLLQRGLQLRDQQLLQVQIDAIAARVEAMELAE